MEKEKPFLFTDLVPPGEVYIPDESDVIPVRTWSRGDPYAQDADGGFSRLPEKEPVAISVSTDGMLHCSALQNVHDGSESQIVVNLTMGTITTTMMITTTTKKKKKFFLTTVV